ncbi:MAG: MxaD protein [Methylotenera sp.]|nr:MAG: MxaD protein [Methylotenera sp.]
MQFVRQLFVAVCFLPLAVSAANAPSQQKVIREVVIKAEPAKVWAVIGNFAGLHKWHPAVESSTTETKADEKGEQLLHRTLILKGGGTILEKETAHSNEEMKLEYRIVEGVLPVSGYRSNIVVKAGANPNETIVNWTGRFYNKANKVDAPKGEDNETAVKAIEAVYDSGLANLKAMLEK